MEKFWRWIEEKEYGERDNCTLFDESGRWIKPTKQILAGYMFEYIFEKVFPKTKISTFKKPEFFITCKTANFDEWYQWLIKQINKI